MGERTRSQKGSVWVILLVLAALVLGAWQYSEHKAEQKRAAREAAENEAQQRERAAREAERLELEKRLAAEKAKSDALVTANKALDALLIRWDDALKVAHSTGRIALATPVASLQGLRREAAELTVSPCMDPAKALLEKSMQNTVDGFIVFMRNELKIGDVLAQGNFEDAAAQFTAFKQARAQCGR